MKMLTMATLTIMGPYKIQLTQPGPSGPQYTGAYYNRHYYHYTPEAFFGAEADSSIQTQLEEMAAGRNKGGERGFDEQKFNKK